MTTPPAPAPSLTPTARSRGLAALVTASVLSGVMGLADADHAAQLAQRQQAAPQAIAQVLVAPQA